ncbi:Putative Small secreted protein [Aspergillus calidoustus]|uniref:Putative Small secreted protein n=1 Tax=Aspergillus calidoustus TaxID=454130 RepID=A0A0U5CA51_ASPCI|nr:Putative Small secreted protein [Aspergillus calidoustus]
MKLTNPLIILMGLVAPVLVAATLDPASSNTKGYKPTALNCSAAKISAAIQAAECSHNTRTSAPQTFAVFQIDHQYDGINGSPYGTCSAYTCTPPPEFDDGELDPDEDYWIFYWSDSGTESGVGTGCIRDPNTGECGCENSDGTFVVGGDSCV